MLPDGCTRQLRYPTELLTRNTFSEFVGYECLKQTLQSGPPNAHNGLGCLETFEKWASTAVRELIFRVGAEVCRRGTTSRQVIISIGGCFRWTVWGFCFYCSTSAERSSYGYKYTVFAEDRDQLLKDPEWMQRHKRGIELITLAWGWDIQKGQPVTGKDGKDQRWHHYPVRFYKCALSTWLFGYAAYFASLRAFALHLVRLHGQRALDSYIIALFSLTSEELAAQRNP